MSIQTAPKEVFLSYAEADKDLGLELEEHLWVLRREGVITTWHKGQIGAGEDRDKEMGEHLGAASVIVLLLSAGFMASEACYGVEMQQALARHQAGETWVIPVLLRPMDDWQNTPIGSLQALPSNGKPVVSWSDHDDAWADVVRGIRSVLYDGKLPPSVVPSPTLPAVWNIPYLRNIFFTGREHLLQQLADGLRTSRAIAISQPHVISGLGGIGKTQIAVEYAYRHYQDYQTVLWVGASTRESLVSGSIAIAELLNLPQKSEQDQAVIIEAVKSWLQTHSSWLLVLDNADDLSLAYDFLPQMGGHLLITTRAQVTGTQAQRVEVDIMPQEVGALFLLHRSKLIAQDVPLTDVSEASQTLAREICEELGGLPLALDQAGAYIEEMHCSLQDYRQRYQTRRTLLLQRRGGLVADHPEPVAATWSLSFEKVEKKSAVAADLLRLCAFLHPDAIPVELIIGGAAYLGPTLARVSEDEMALDEAIAQALAYSLIRRNVKEKTLSVHRLVQAVLRDTMDEPTRKVWAERAVLAVHTVFPSVSFATWSQCERYLPHAQVCASFLEKGNRAFPEAGDLLNQAGWYLKERARYSEAEPLIQQGLAIRRQCREPMHGDIASSLNILGYLYIDQGRLTEAEPLWQQALTIDEMVFGSDHREVATDLNNLAELYREQGKYAEAEPLYKRALLIYEQQLGERHPLTAMGLNNLALLYQRQGKYAEAEPLYQRALAIWEQQLGEMHPSTARGLNNLAGLYRAQGKYAEAEPLYKRSLAIRGQQLGEMHPSTATGLNNLAALYDAQGKYTEAESLFKRALTVFEQTLGEAHPDTQTVREWYVSLLRKMGRAEEAASLEAGGHEKPN